MPTHLEMYVVYQVEIDILIFNQTAREALYYPALELRLVTNLIRFNKYQLAELSTELLLPRVSTRTAIDHFLRVSSSTKIESIPLISHASA